jgi:serine/threonine protein kinase
MSPFAATTVDAAALADELARFRIISPTELLSELLAEFPGGGPAGLAEFLVGRGVLTNYQAARALAGETRQLAPGPYRLTAVHRAGTLGPVFRAVHVSKPGAFAVKLLPLRSLWQARQAKQLARSLARLGSYPRVVPLVDADSAGGSHYLAWPLTDDTLLADQVARTGPLPPHAAAAVLADLAAALAACHARQVPHGLLSPRAVGLTPEGGARLLELGAGLVLAQNLAADESLFDTLSTTIAVAGMLDFAAPELIADPTRPSPATDLYALGAVGFFALTGRLAARRSAGASVREVNPQIPAELARVIDRLLRPDPAERFSGADEVRERLAEAAGQLDPPRPGPVSPGNPPADAVDPGHVLNAVPSEPDRRNGAASWAPVGAGVARPARRDDTDASVGFDLPAEPLPLAAELEPVDTPWKNVLAETPPSTPRPVRPRATAHTPEQPSPPAAGSPTRPDPQLSPAPSEDPNMAKPLHDPFDPSLLPPPKPRPTKPPVLIDPRLSMPIPVQWHVAGDATPMPAPTADEPAPANSVLWKRVKRNLLFWQAVTDTVWVSVFAPPDLTQGQTVKLTIFIHPPEATDSVRALSRAFQHDAELVGTGATAREVARNSKIAVHLWLTNAGASRSLVEVVWTGQPQRLNFDLYVPWESPAGPAPGMVSVGQDEVRIGKAAFSLNVLPAQTE